MLPEVKIEYLLLITLAQASLSLLASYVPKFREWFAALTDVEKSLGMLGAVTFITVAVGILSFTGIWQLVPANKDGIIYLVFQWMMALQANQTTYKLSPQTDTVKVIKADLAKAEIITIKKEENA